MGKVPDWAKVTLVVVTWPVSLPLLAVLYGLGFYRGSRTTRRSDRPLGPRTLEADADEMRLLDPPHR
jgi:hypothetical protein